MPYLEKLNIRLGVVLILYFFTISAVGCYQPEKRHIQGRRNREWGGRGEGRNSKKARKKKEKSGLSGYIGLKNDQVADIGNERKHRLT